MYVLQLVWLGNGPKNKNMCVGERIRATFEGWFKVGLYSIVSREKVAHKMEIIIFFLSFNWTVKLTVKGICYLRFPLQIDPPERSVK